MTIIDVSLEDCAYPIHIERGLLPRADTVVPAPPGGRAQVVVTDENIAELHLDILCRGLDRAVETIVLPPGESSKSWTQLENLVERLLSLGVERGDTIVALGGGVIGDLTGFAASVLKRGCGFVQVPTTLLAQVDSSVGGKTAINAAMGKNLVGTFHQPVAVLIDPEVLSTLPAREMRAGYAETVKYGLIRDADFFAWCEANGAALVDGDLDRAAEAIARSCAVKAEIVAADERETKDVRALLNLGHTFGHALEAESGFSDRLLHGEAVAIGMVLAFRYAARARLCKEADAVRVAAHLSAVGLPTEIPAFADDPDRLIAHMRQDKKARGGRVPLILPTAIGAAYVDDETDIDAVRDFLASLLPG